MHISITAQSPVDTAVKVGASAGALARQGTRPVRLLRDGAGHVLQRATAETEQHVRAGAIIVGVSLAVGATPCTIGRFQSSVKSQGEHERGSIGAVVADCTVAHIVERIAIVPSSHGEDANCWLEDGLSYRGSCLFGNSLRVDGSWLCDG